MTWSRTGLLVSAAALEAVAALALVRGLAAQALALHVGASACVAAWVRPRLLSGRGAASVGFPFACAACVPVLGGLGLVALAVALPLLERPRIPSEQFVHTPPPRAPGLARSEDPAPRPAARPPGGRDARLAAVAAARGRDDPASVALIQRALRDPDEEVRLLAFALLEARASAAYRSVFADEQELERAAGAQRGALQARIAYQRWELAWLGLVQGEVLNHELELAERHGRAALEHDPRSAALHFLLGRIQLKRMRLDEARAAFQRAAELGVPDPSIAPYLAEIAFLQRRFDLLRIYLSRMGPATGNDPVARLQRYWS